MTAFLNPASPLLELATFFLTLLVGLGTILLLQRFWKWELGRDSGDGVRKMQAKPVLRVGGLALYLVFLVSFLLARPFSDSGDGSILGLTFLVLGSIMFLLGFADDLFGLPASIRLLVQIGVGIAAYLGCMQIDIVSKPFGSGGIDIGGFSLLLTIIWFVAIPNLINLVDGMDGLAGGIALFLCLTLATLGGLAGNGELVLLNVALAGGIVAFLVFNLPPAKIYMGDGGAYLLGFAIAGASLLTSNKGSIFGSLLVVILALGFPILDTALAIVRRGLSGLPVMKADARHLHHRLLTLGFSERTIILVLYGVFAGLSLLGLSVFLTAGYTLPVVGMVVTIGLIQGLRFVGLPRSLAEARVVIRDILAARKDVRYAHVMTQVLEHDLDRVESAGTFWESIRLFLTRLGITPAIMPLDQAKPANEGCLVILEIDSHYIWVLNCPSPIGTRRQWERVVRCFHPAIVGGLKRWGGTLPASLGFMELPPGTDLKEFEESLNADMVLETELDDETGQPLPAEAGR